MKKLTKKETRALILSKMIKYLLQHDPKLLDDMDKLSKKKTHKISTPT